MISNQLFNELTVKIKHYGRSLQPPSSDNKLNALRVRSRQELGCDISNDYCDLLATVNGLDWNGLVIYANERVPIPGYSDRFIEGFVEGNLDFRDFEPWKDYLIYADDGVVLFTYHISQQRYEVVLRVGMSLLESFDTFNDLLTNALSGHM